MLKGKHILLGITGSIAAYKAAILVRLLVKEGAEVKVVMTPLAKEFIAPLTLATLSKNPILIDFFNPENGDWNSHVDLGLWADLMLVAPASANTIAKMANGIADNLLLTSYLSARCTVMVAPAMDLDMFQHPATTKNISTLTLFGNTIIEPATGELASGLEGKGRMEEPEKIVEIVKQHFSNTKTLDGKHVLVTAGPTLEAIDPVRFISNHSTGKMGYAIVDELVRKGARVTLITGPVSLSPFDHKMVQTIRVTSALEMYNASVAHFPACNGAIMTAAVADYRPVAVAPYKMKKKDTDLSLMLTTNPDIAATLGSMKQKGQILAGFALETDNPIENAKQKLTKKHLDFIVLNSLSDEGAGFGSDTNKITIIDAHNNLNFFELKSKLRVASDIVEKFSEYFKTSISE